ncbi:MAG: hypothetical protein ACXW3E_07875, partial [Thermoanaerobaculia bacterium]
MDTRVVLSRDAVERRATARGVGGRGRPPLHLLFDLDGTLVDRYQHVLAPRPAWVITSGRCESRIPRRSSSSNRCWVHS